MSIETPEVWSLFGLLIHQDFLSHYPDFLSGIRSIVGDLTDDQKLQLLTFIEAFLGSDPSVKEYVQLWESSGSSYLVAGDQIEGLLRTIAGEIRIVLGD